MSYIEAKVTFNIDGYLFSLNATATRADIVAAAEFFKQLKENSDLIVSECLYLAIFYAFLNEETREKPLVSLYDSLLKNQAIDFIEKHAEPADLLAVLEAIRCAAEEVLGRTAYMYFFTPIYLLLKGEYSERLNS